MARLWEINRKCSKLSRILTGVLKSGVAVARRGGSLQVLDPLTGKVVWSRVDPRVKPDDMFVALQETNGHLFWCTNYGYFGFVPLVTSPRDIETPGSLDSIPLEGLTEFV